MASFLVNADWSVSPETRILKYYLNDPIGQLSDFQLPSDPRQVPSVIFYRPIVLFWQQACLALDVDIISLDLTEKLPFTFKRQQINTVRLI